MPVLNERLGAKPVVILIIIVLEAHQLCDSLIASLGEVEQNDQRQHPLNAV